MNRPPPGNRARAFLGVTRKQVVIYFGAMVVLFIPGIVAVWSFAAFLGITWGDWGSMIPYCLIAGTAGFFYGMGANEIAVRILDWEDSRNG